jgi:hypothetical protein
VRQIAVNGATVQLKGGFLGRSQLRDAFRDQTVITTSASLDASEQDCHSTPGSSALDATDRKTDGRWTIGAPSPGRV